MLAITKQQDESDYLKAKVDGLEIKVDRILDMLVSQVKGEPSYKRELKGPDAEDTSSTARQSEESSETRGGMVPPTPVLVKRESHSKGPPASAATIDHSVGVHRLFRWPTIRALTTDPQVLSALHISKFDELKEDFILKLEKEKGVLRVYGVGQGQDHFDGALTAAPIEASTPPGLNDPIVRRSPAASPPDVWGTTLGLPNMIDGKYANDSDNDHPGGLNRDGSLKMDGDTMNSLFLSYIRNIHILHPFLHELRLRRMLERVWTHMNPWESQNSQFLNDPYSRKRRRSADLAYSPEQVPSYQLHQRPEPEHRISTVIVLLVMALGKMCQERKPLRGPVPESLHSRTPGLSSVTSQGSGSPTYTSPSQISSPAMNSPRDIRPRLYGDESEYQRKVASSFRKFDKNVDVIPGLGYFAYATKILGALQGGSDLPYVQANLLASLYCGQHASSLQSWSYLEQACRICLDLMKG